MSNIQGVLTISLTDEDAELLEAFHNADEITRKQFLKILKSALPLGTPVSEFLQSIEQLRADMTPDEIESFRRIVENDFNQSGEE